MVTSPPIGPIPAFCEGTSTIFSAVIVMEMINHALFGVIIAIGWSFSPGSSAMIDTLAKLHERECQSSDSYRLTYLD
jgi:hypothetical protein